MGKYDGRNNNMSSDNINSKEVTSESSSVFSSAGNSFRSDDSYYDEDEEFTISCLNKQQYDSKKLNDIDGEKMDIKVKTGKKLNVEKELVESQAQNLA